MLLDHIDVVFSAGHGGAGKVSFKRLGKGPDGGNGGKGGDLYVTCTSDLSLLNQFSRKAEVSAEDGVPGNEATYSQSLAQNARAAWPFTGTDALCMCSGNAQCVYRQTATSCAVWMYTKTNAGHVRLKNRRQRLALTRTIAPVKLHP
jgi:GTPase involved in cell partitioning and DNA repair